MRTCNNCYEEKELECFETFRQKDKEYRRKICQKCRTVKNRKYRKEHYARNAEESRAKRKEYYQKCREQELEYVRNWEKKNSDKVALYRRRAKWRSVGIDIKEAEALFADWDGKCAICKEKTDKPCVDHCHTSLQVRAILCSNCNCAIGLLKEDVSRMEAAIEYIKKFSI